MGFGTALCAWDKVRHVFHCHKGTHPTPRDTYNGGPLKRLPNTLLVDRPVDCLSSWLAATVNQMITTKSGTWPKLQSKGPGWLLNFGIQEQATMTMDL